MDLKGEAVVVEVKPGKHLFALFRNYPDLIELQHRPGQDAIDVAEMIERSSENMTITLPPSAYPKLATFSDLHDSKTVKEVKPERLNDFFGSGVTLRSITLSVSSETMTRGIVDALLPWLGPYPEPRLIPIKENKSNDPFIHMVAQGDFIKR